MANQRVLTKEIAENIATLLKDPCHTLTSATVLSGLSPNVTRLAMSRYDRELCSETEYAIVDIIAQALQKQFYAQRVAGLSASEDKNKVLSEWQRWRLETSAPAEHARIQKTELTGKDGEPLEFKDLSLAELLKLSAEDE